MTSYPAVDADADEQLLRRLAVEIVRRRLTTPAILFLESMRPLNFVGSQFLTFLDPLLSVFCAIPDYRRFARLLEDRDGIERLIGHIEGIADLHSP